MQPIPHPFPFDPAYGFSPAALRDFTLDTEPPADFADFWRELHAQAMAVPLQLKIDPVTDFIFSGQRILRVTYSAWPDYRVGAWVCLPAEGPSPGLHVVCGHGYGGREAPDEARCGPDRAVIFPSAPGFHVSADPRLPLNDCARHVVHGIESRETYVLAACAAALWRAPDALAEVCGTAAKVLHYFGWSFGGGMGALMLPWDSRFHSAELGQVTFGHHPFRLRHPCVGSGQAVRERWLRDPSVAQTLAYYDTAHSLQFLGIPTAFACSNFDPAVPPPGQWAAANAHPGPKRITAFPTGHFDFPHPETPAADAQHLRHLQELIPALFPENLHA